MWLQNWTRSYHGPLPPAAPPSGHDERVQQTADAPTTRVVVVGAGQAGLSVAYHLRRLGLRPHVDWVVLDRGPAAGGAWQHRWASLRLGAAHRVADLPGMAELGLSFDTADRSAPARDVVRDYYARYEEHFELPVLRPAAVRDVIDLGGRLRVRYAHRASDATTDPATGGSSGATTDTADATIDTEALVTATGTWGTPFVPWYPGRDGFRGRQVHTSSWVDSSEFEGLDVVVVGGGTSAIGFVLDLEGVASSTTWVSRRPVEWRDGTEQLGVGAAVAAVAEQDAAARAGLALPSIVSGTGVPLTRRFRAGIERGTLVERPVFTAIEPDGVRLADGGFRHADVIVWATGFRPELRHLAPLGLRSGGGGVAVADGVSTRDPRVFFAGYGPQASTIGANRAGRAIARQVVSLLESRRD